MAELDPSGPLLDICFPVTGPSLPADHGYALFAAVTTLVPALHERVDYGIHPVAGRPLPGRQLLLTRASHLVFRAPAGLSPVLVWLAGQRIEVAGHQVRVGAPHLRLLRPATALRSRLVAIKGGVEPELFIIAARRQLDQLGVAGQLSLPNSVAGQTFEGRSPGRQGPVRRTLQVSGKEIIGYSVVVSGLTPEESVLLQEHGIGGRRRFGCGVMVPAR